MTSFSRTTATFVSTVLFAVASFAAQSDTDGAKIGVWTQDYDAAIALAKEKNLPVMLNFTGSDWCGWCKLMDKQVFSTDEWTNWATNNIVLVFLDFPQDKTLVPEKYVQRNQQLAGKYGIQGYPTYVVVNPADGKTIDTLGASREATAKGFIEDLERILIQRPGVDLSKYLSAEELKKVEALKSEKEKAEKALNDFGKKFNEELTALNEKIAKAPDKTAKSAAEIAFKARYKALSKEGQPLVEAAEKVNQELSDLLEKAIKAKKSAL